MDSSGHSSRVKPLYRGTQIVWYITWLIEALLAFRFVLKFLGANPSAGFSGLIYGVSYPFAAPFLNVFRITQVKGSLVEWTTILAMLVYWLIAWGIVRLLLLSKPVSAAEAAEELEKQDK
jgi:disulfide bond formation protein DsbB